MTDVIISKDDLQDLTIFAQRYAIGRMTYAPDTIKRFVIKHLADLKSSVLQIIIDDIKMVDERNGLGWECDKQTWLGLLDILHNELKKRGVK